MGNTLKKVTATQLRESLYAQLIKRGSDIDAYRSLIEDYIWFWQQEKAMQRDIRKRGRTYTAVSSTGKEYEKNNPSVKDALLYSKQMVQILTALGLSADSVISDREDDADGDLG